MPYLIVAVVVVIFIAVVFIVAGKDSKERIDMVSKLTEAVSYTHLTLPTIA